MKIHLAPVAVLALGIAFGCSAETSEAGSSATTPPTNEASQAENAVAQTVENLDASSAARLLAENSDVVVLDIRTPAEYEAGHLKGALNIDYRAENFAEQLGALDKEKTYLVH